jgi:hypothetical protein
MKNKTISIKGLGVWVLFLWSVLFPQAGFSGQNLPKDSNIGVVAAQSRTNAARLSAYASVEPITLLKLNAALAGIVSGITVLPERDVQVLTDS